MSVSFKIAFYKTIRGKSIVEEYIKKRSRSTQVKVIHAFDLLQEYGFDLLGTHWMKKIHSHPDLYELRVKSVVEYRFLFYFTDNSYFILSGFEKKKQKIPKKEIDLAIQRYAENAT